MNTKVPTKFYIVPVVYCALIGLFIYLHLFSFESFSQQIGYLTLEGKVNGDTVQTLSLTMSPLIFEFSKKTPIRVEGKNGTKTAVIQTYSPQPNGAELRFSENLVLRIEEGDPAKREIILQLIEGPEADEESVYSFNYLLEDNSDWKTAGRIPVLSLKKGELYSILSSSQGVLIDPEQTRIRLSGANGTLPSLLYQSVEKKNHDPLTFWFSSEAFEVEEGAYVPVITQYVEDAYRGWQNSRYEQAAGEWESGEGSYTFDEQLINAFFAEAVQRGEYEEMYLQYNSSVRSHRGELTHQTAPFIGNLTQTAPVLREERDGLISSISAKTANNDYNVFTLPDLIPIALNHAPFSLVEELYQLARTADCNTLDYSICLGIARTVLQGDPLLLPDEDSYFDYESIIERGILPWITKTEEGLFLEISNGIVDTVASLKAGTLLIEAGEQGGNETFESIGRYLVTSVLSLSEARGFLPKKLVIRNGAITEQHERVAPETVYTLLVENPYYPREIPLNKEIAPGSWVYTCADIHSINISRQEAAIELSFPEGMSHHIIIQGIPPFRGIQFYGINWVSDPSFEAYSSGWAYDAEGQTLYIKLRHRQERETIRILF